MNSDVQLSALIDLKIDKDNKIHTDFHSHEFGSPLVKQLLWGTYHRKPVAQMDFDHLVIKACQKISAADEVVDHDFRPRIKDLNSGLSFLIDTAFEYEERKWQGASAYTHSGQGVRKG